MNRYGKRYLVITCCLALLISISSFLAGCTPTEENVPGPGPSQENPVAPEEKLNVAVYYVKVTQNDAYLVREVHQISPTQEPARAALEELINVNPVSPGAVRVLPAAAKINGINIKDGLATVDFSREILRANTGAAGEILGIQSMVNTLTEFPSIQKVSFTVEGEVDQETKDWWGHVGLYEQPFSRDVSVVHEPSIWVTSPALGQKVESPLQVKGSARVFEATVNVRLVDESGEVIVESFTTATEGAPGRGQFELSLPFDAPSPGRGELEVFWTSPKDGKELDKIAVPVNW